MGSGRCAQFCQLHPLPEPESLPLLLLLLHRALRRPLTGDMGSGRCAQFCQLHPLPEPESLPSWIPSCADLWLSLPFLSKVNRWVAHGVQMPIQQNARTFDRENKSPSHHLPFVRNEVQRMIRLSVIIIPEETVHNTAATVMCSPPPPPPFFFSPLVPLKESFAYFFLFLYQPCGCHVSVYGSLSFFSPTSYYMII